MPVLGASPSTANYPRFRQVLPGGLLLARQKVLRAGVRGEAEDAGEADEHELYRAEFVDAVRAGVRGEAEDAGEENREWMRDIGG